MQVHRTESRVCSGDILGWELDRGERERCALPQHGGMNNGYLSKDARLKSRQLGGRSLQRSHVRAVAAIGALIGVQVPARSIGPCS